MSRKAGGLETASLTGWGEVVDMIPKEALEAVERIVAQGREAIVRKEHGKWVVIENKRRLVYKEQ